MRDIGIGRALAAGDRKARDEERPAEALCARRGELAPALYGSDAPPLTDDGAAHVGNTWPPRGRRD